MPRKPHKYHFIYKTTCTINENFYYGMHSTSNLEDGYIGSGTRLWHSIKKHGRENFKCEILEFLPDRKALVAREKELITEEMLHDPMCMNLKPGGEGGFCNEEHALKFHIAGGKAFNIKNVSDIEYVNMYMERLNWHNAESRIKTAAVKLKKYGSSNAWKGRKHKEESKLKISEKNSINQKGEKNSQFNTCWINNGVDNKKIKKDELNLYLSSNNWVLGRKIKF